MALSGTEKKALKELHLKISDRYEIADFRIYGSKVLGKDVPGSDIDIMVVLEETSHDIESRIDDIIFDINLKYDCLINAIFFSVEELKDGPFHESPIYKKAVAEGIRI